jgi:hypothetical protein
MGGPNSVLISHCAKIVFCPKISRHMGNGAMPIDHMITDETLSPDERHVLSLAFNSALRKLELIQFALLSPRG